MIGEQKSVPRRLPPHLERFRLESRTTAGHTCQVQGCAVCAMEEYLEDFRGNVRRRVGLLLSGPNGFGKSGFLAVLHKDKLPLVRPNWGARNRIWCQARDIATLYGYGYEDEEFDEPIDTIFETARWLVVDELGREQGIKNFDQRMHSVLQRRIENRCITLFATNLSLDDTPGKPGTIHTVYGEGFWSRLFEACLAVTILGSDRRKM